VGQQIPQADVFRQGTVGHRCFHSSGGASAKRERERFHAGIEKLDLELSIVDRYRCRIS
jgi:hypothetical protein